MIPHSLRHAFRRATSLKEGGKAASPRQRIKLQFAAQYSAIIVGAVIDRPCGITLRIRPNPMRIRYIFLPGD